MELRSCWNTLSHYKSKFLYHISLRPKQALVIFLLLGFCLFLLISSHSHPVCQGTLSSHPNNSLRVPIKFPINRPDLCRNNTVFLLIYVHSAPDNEKQRAFIRSTWGSPVFQELFAMKLIFILGVPEDISIQTKIHDESEINRDMIQCDFRDSYRNLTLKESCSLQWAATHCPAVEYTMKADDDLIIQPWLTAPWLRDLEFKNTILCHSWWPGSPVERDPGHKWYMPVTVFDGDCYPGYCSGAVRIYSKGTPGRLVNASDWETELLVPLEDVYFSGIVADRAGVTRVHERWLVDLRDYFTENSDWRRFMVFHAKDLVMQRILWKELMTTKEFLTRPAGSL